MRIFDISSFNECGTDTISYSKSLVEEDSIAASLHRLLSVAKVINCFGSKGIII